MHLIQLVNRFNFQHQSILDKDIDPKCCFKRLVLVNQRHRNLSSNFKPPCLKPSCQYGFIHSLKQTWAKVSMDSDCFINDYSADFINLHDKPSLRPLRIFATLREIKKLESQRRVQFFHLPWQAVGIQHVHEWIGVKLFHIPHASA